MTQRTVEINVIDRKLKVACPIGQESALLSAAAELSDRITIANNSKSIANPEQALLMTALNLANDLLAARRQLKTEKKENKQKITLLQSTIEQALAASNKKQA
jgi:cell division protein ZapA